MSKVIQLKEGSNEPPKIFKVKKVHWALKPRRVVSNPQEYQHRLVSGEFVVPDMPMAMPIGWSGDLDPQVCVDTESFGKPKEWYPTEDMFRPLWELLPADELPECSNPNQVGGHYLYRGFAPIVDIGTNDFKRDKCGED